MPGPGTTNSAKNAPLIKQGHTTTGKHGDDPYTKGKVTKPRPINPKG